MKIFSTINTILREVREFRADNQRMHLELMSRERAMDNQANKLAGFTFEVDETRSWKKDEIKVGKGLK